MTIVALAASARLAIVVVATPPAARLIDYPSLLLSAEDVDDRIADRAEWAAGKLSDAALVPARLASCESRLASKRAVGPMEEMLAALEACLAIIDAGLAANPTSGELWMERARLLFQTRQVGDAFAAAFRNSYRTSAREGWIASARVVLGLYTYRLLPADVRSRVIGDLDIVLETRTLAGPLVATYVSDPAFRSKVLSALDQIPLQKQRRFLSFVKEHLDAPQ